MLLTRQGQRQSDSGAIETTKLRQQRLIKKNVFKLTMPQLIPFYFMNQLSFSMLSLLVLVYFLSKYVLPNFTFQNVIRMFITKLSNLS